MPVAQSPAHYINSSKGCPSITESFRLVCFLVLCATVAALPVVQPHWINIARFQCFNEIRLQRFASALTWPTTLFRFFTRYFVSSFFFIEISMTSSSTTSSRPRLVLTGYGPFGGHKVNTSWQAVKIVRDSLWDNGKVKKAS
jgi:hypothetical protein